MSKVMEIPTEYRQLFDSTWREAAVYGGRYSLKSHTVARVLLVKARQKKTRIACFREFQNSIADSSHQLLKDLIELYGLTDFSVTDNSIINTVNGSDFLFKGLHRNEQSIKSIEGIDIAWVEEAQTVSGQSLETLTPTIRKPGSQIIYTYNRLLEEDPVHKRLVLEGRPNTLVLKVNYDIALKYNLLPDEILNEIESDRLNRPSLYTYKWLGEPNSRELQIYKDWATIDDIPHEAKLVRRGVDFGYTNDPCAIVDVYQYNGGYILDELLYRKGMHNAQIAAFLKNQPEQVLTIADSSEPKSIAEIAAYGVVILGADKRNRGTGENYKTWGISLVQQQKISVTRRSKNIIAERLNYFWKKDKEDKILNIPEDGNDHHMDAIRYAIESLNPQYEDKKKLKPTSTPVVNRITGRVIHK